MFHNRESAARQLAVRLQDREFRDPLVLAIPRGGVVLGVVLAQELGAELDVLLSRKLRAPGQPELALGAVSEDGGVYLDPYVEEYVTVPEGYLGRERQFQAAEIERRKALFRSVRPKAAVAGRSLIVTDDGIATGSTMIAALQVLRSQQPHEIIVAVPVGSPERLDEVSRWCDELLCLYRPQNFWALAQFYEDFCPVEDAEVVKLLRRHATRAAPKKPQPTVGAAQEAQS